MLNNGLNDGTWYVVLMLLVVLAATTILAMVMPALSRRDILFGVTVPPHSRELPQARRIITGYSVLLLLGTLLAAAILVAEAQIWGIARNRATILAFIIASLLAQLLPFLWAYYQTRRLARTLGSGQVPAAAPSPPAAVLAPRRYRDLVPPVWELASLLLIGATTSWLAWLYPMAPDPFASHFDVNGQPNHFMAKTPFNWFLVVGIQLMLWVVLTLVSWSITLSKAVPTEADARFRAIWTRLLFGLKLATLLEIGVVSVASSLAAVQRTPMPGWFLFTSIAFTLVVLLVMLIFSLRTGQGGSRLDPSDANATDRMADKYWFLGSIYVNRSDPAFFVERRFGIGWTFNLGNPLGLAIIIGLLALAVGYPLLLALSSR